MKNTGVRLLATLMFIVIICSYGKAGAVEQWRTSGTIDELWIIDTSGVEVDQRGLALGRYDEGTAGECGLHTMIDGKEVALPLEHTDVKGTVSAFISTVEVVQKYHNPYGTKIEAVYVFPLPQDAAVTDFFMVVGDRRIRGEIREREQATQMYEDAREEGYVASLLTQERPNVFTQRVANIEPGKDVDIHLTYFSPLKYHDGEYEFVFPTVVGPRFNPPGFTDGIGSVARGMAGISGQKDEVQYLAPDERSGHDISISLDIDAGVEIEKVYSRTHAIDVDKQSPSRVSVALSPNDRIPNKDFVLRYKVAGDQMKKAMLVHSNERGNYFALVLQPPENMENLPRMPREMVFVLDCSGSMSGIPIEKSKEAMRRCLSKLRPDDTFQIIRFSDSASAFGPNPVPATPDNIRRALKYVNNLNGRGGTMMIKGIRAALDFPHDENRLRIVSFMTDGYIGNDSEILAAIEEEVGPSRIFSFGVGSAVNRYLLEGMARLGRGAVAYVGLRDSSAEKVDRFYDRAARPALADVEIDWGGLNAFDVYPTHIPDVFVGRPVMITGRFAGNNPAYVRVNGRAGGEHTSFLLDVNPRDAENHHPGIESLWARWKLADLSDQEITDPSDALREEIIETSITYHLLSAYTAFVAIDESVKTSGEEGASVVVPVPMPEGVSYEANVQTGVYPSSGYSQGGSVSFGDVAGGLLFGLAKARESARRSACVNNMKQLGLILNMYANENEDMFPPIDDTRNNFMFEGDVMYPEYLSDAAILMCPSDPDNNPYTNFRLGAVNDHPGFPVGTVHPDCMTNLSYCYLGWLVTSDAEAEAFFAAYDKLSPADRDKDIIVPKGKGNGGGHIIYRLEAGASQFLSGTPMADPSRIPVMWDMITAEASEASHVPLGGNVLYLDGHVDFLRYPNTFPISPTMVKLLSERARDPIPDCDCAPETLMLRSTVGHAADAIGDNEWLELAVLMAVLVGTGFLFGLGVSRTSKTFRALLYVFLFIFIVLFGILMLPFFLTALITDKLVRQHHKRASAGAHPEPETV